MKVMKNKWCWMGLVLCTSSLAWGAKDKGEKKPDADAKESASAEKAEASGDEAATKDETADEEEEEAPKARPKKAEKTVKAEVSTKRSSNVLSMGILGSLGASTYTRLGLGLRAGLTLGPKEGLYIGAVGTYFAGTSVSQVRLSSPPNAEKTRSAFVAGVEVGYDVEAATDFLVRPYLAPGIAYVVDKTCATGECTDENGIKMSLAPGLQGVYSFGAVYFGADLRYQIIMNASDASAAVISLTGGLRL